MSAAAGAAIGEALGSLGTNAIASAALANDMSQNIKNMRYQGQAQLLNLALQKMSWDREDTAVQRRVADLKAAGLSPVLAAGSAASTMSPIRIEPQKSSFRVDPKSFNMDIASQIMQGLVSKSAIDKMEAETLKINQQRELDLLSYPERIANIQARTSAASQEAAFKAWENLVYRRTGVNPRSGSEVGKTARDIIEVLNNAFDTGQKKTKK